MTDVISADGVFWKADNPDQRVSGHFTAELGQNPEVTLTDELVPDPRVSVTYDASRNVVAVAHSAEAKRSVAAFLAITVHGELDSSVPLTLLRAQNHGGSGFKPHYYATSAVVGAHVSDDQLYTAVRFRMDRPYSLAHLADGESCVVEDDGSTLTSETSESDGWDKDNWLVYESATRATLRQLEIRVVSGCLALLQLAMYPAKDRKTRETQVRIEPGGAWLPVYGPAFCAQLCDFEHEPLLRPDQLSIERYAKWIALHSKLDGLTWVVARPFKGAEQVRVLLFSTLIEGFHRALDGYEKAKFPGVDPKVLRAILEAARGAATVQAAAEGLDASLVEKAVTLFTEVSFQERARAIVAEVSSVVPEIVESIANPPQRITKARNALAHHLTRDATRPLETRALEWRVVSNVAAWLLRCLLLLRVGIEPEVLHERLLMCQRFAFFRANTAQHVSELGWALPASS